MLPDCFRLINKVKDINHVLHLQFRQVELEFVRAIDHASAHMGVSAMPILHSQCVYNIFIMFYTSINKYMEFKMDWVQFAIMIVTFIGLFIWNRTESRADIRHMDAKLESNKNLTIEIHKENQAIIEVIRKETQTVVDAIRQDMRDFHVRLERQDAEFKAFLMYSKDKRTT
jgi:amino acid permease